MRLIAVLLTLLPLTASAADASATPDRWAKEMQRFDKLDAAEPTKSGSVVITGSSSARLWNVEKWFPKQNVLNRGFGGSQYSDVVRHVDRLIVRHSPRVVVLYSGDNDVKGGKTPDTIAKDVRTIIARVHDQLPETKIIVVGIKPSLARWELAEPMRAANARLKSICEQTDRCEYVDVWSAMLGEDGTPRTELFVKDGLHLSDEGYALWTELVAPHLE